MKNIEFGSLTDKGLVRPENEDNLGYTPTPNGDLFVVCDGMGGHVGGKVASTMAVDSIIQYFTAKKYHNPVIALNEAIQYANTKVFEKSKNDNKLRGMGTTVTILLYQPDDTVYIAHVGDSRIYINSSGKLHRLTKDHSYVQQLVDQNIISDSQAEKHPQKNQLLKALGTSPNVEPNIPSQPVMPKKGDLFMLCSDGLCGLVNDMTLQEITNKTDVDIHKMAHILVNTAKNAGGTDNITVQLIRVKNSTHTESTYKNLSPKDARITVDEERDKSVITTVEPDNIKLENNENENKNNIDENQQHNNNNLKRNKLIAIIASATVLLFILIFVLYRIITGIDYRVMSYKNKVVIDSVDVGSKKEAIKIAEKKIKDKNEDFVVKIFRIGKNGNIVKNDDITEMRGSGGKPYAVFVYDENGNVRRARDFFETIEEANKRFLSYLTDYATYNGFTIKLLGKDDEGSFVVEKKTETIEYEEPTPTSEPSAFIKYKVKASDNWIKIYNKYGVCPCYIKRATKNIKLDGKGNPRIGEVYMIPKHYSSMKKYNPNKYQKYTKDKVGYVNGQCTKLTPGTCKTKTDHTNTSLIDTTNTNTKDTIIVKIDSTKTNNNNELVKKDSAKTTNKLSPTEQRKLELETEITGLENQIKAKEKEKEELGVLEFSKKNQVQDEIDELKKKKKAKEDELKKLSS